jgi:hypothetical protein
MVGPVKDDSFSKILRFVKNNNVEVLFTGKLSKEEWIELSKEYTYRYNKHHKSTDVIQWCLNNLPNIPDIGFTPPALAMPDQYKVDDFVQSYRNYYIGEKKGFATWKNREIPYWFK